MRVKVVLFTTSDGTYVDSVVDEDTDDQTLIQVLTNLYNDGRTFDIQYHYVSNIEDF